MKTAEAANGEQKTNPSCSRKTQQADSTTASTAQKTPSTTPEASQQPAAGQPAASLAGLGPAAPGAAAGAATPAGPQALAGSLSANSYGAAQPSLDNPACQAGTPEFQAAKVANEKLLQKYRKRKLELEAGGARKADMTASKELLEESLKGTYGHIPGVALGDTFDGRGELVVLGLHTLYGKGICCRKEDKPGAVAICMSGGYADNKDTGAEFEYTGAGGQDKKSRKQIENQRQDHADNAALLRNIDSKTPVRLFRAKADSRLYVYEGLYWVDAWHWATSTDGPQVIQFHMRGVPGHHVVSAKVQYRRPRFLQTVKLAAAEKEKKTKRRGPAPQQDYKWDFSLPTPAAIKKRIEERAQQPGKYGRLVSPDISDGQELVPIPAWNNVDDNDAFNVPSILEPFGVTTDEELTFKYITEYEFTDADEALQLAEEAERLFMKACPVTCGMQYHKGKCPYIGRQLLQTEGYGIMECDHNCRGPAEGKGSRGKCQGTRVASKGIRYPLEVFKVPDKGWGVRCSVDLQSGSVLCVYIGTVMTDKTAELMKGADTYLYDLDHFHQLQEAQEKEQEQGAGGDTNKNTLLPKLPPEMKDVHLVIDASHEGNITRFINHSCDPNCLVQAVFAKDARSLLLYYIAIVVSQDIPAFTELTYDYGHGFVAENMAPEAAAAAAAGGGAAAVRRVRCSCGAGNCRGWLTDAFKL